jgi:hypothetical protein
MPSFSLLFHRSRNRGDARILHDQEEGRTGFTLARAIIAPGIPLVGV